MAIRIATLLPGITQLVQELGALPHVVACSHECASACVGAAVVTEAKLPVGALPDGAAELSAGWATALASGRRLADKACAYYRVDIDALLRAKPTVLLTVVPTRLSPLDPDAEDVVQALKAAVPTLRSVLSVDPASSREIRAAARSVAAVLGRRHAADSMLAAAAVRRDLLRALRIASPRRSVAVVYWAEPCWLAGGYIPEAIEAAGGMSPHIRPGMPSTCCAPGAVAGHDIVIFAICALPLRRALDVARTFVARHRPLFDRRSTAVVAVDATRNFNFATPAVFIDTAEIISDIMHDRRDDKRWAPLQHARSHVPVAT